MSADPFEKYPSSRYFVGNENEAQSLEKVDARIRAIAVRKPRRIIWKWLTVAAAALLLLFVNQFILNKEPDDARLAAQFFEPFPNYQTPVSRGETDLQRLQEAYAYYDRGEYAQAVRAFESGGDLSGTDNLYFAIALQGIGQWDKSGEILNLIRTDLTEEFIPAGKWHHALALVATSRVEEARPVLEELAFGRSSFVQDAEDLLKAIR